METFYDPFPIPQPFRYLDVKAPNLYPPPSLLSHLSGVAMDIKPTALYIQDVLDAIHSLNQVLEERGKPLKENGFLQGLINESSYYTSNLRSLQAELHALLETNHDNI